MIKHKIIFTIAAIVLARPLAAQATRLVDPIDPAYRDLEQLVDAGLVERLSLGQRPLSRAAFARAVDEASRTLARRSAVGLPALAGDARDSDHTRWSFVRELITSLRERLGLPDSTAAPGGFTSEFTPIRKLTLDVTRTDQPTRLIPRDNGLGEIDGFLNTLLLHRQGRPVVSGTTTLVETNHVIESDVFAVSATPELALFKPIGMPGGSKLRMQELEIRFVFRNLAVDAGREYVAWGQGRDVGLLNSNNSPPLDLVKLSSEQPFSFPWLFRRLGPTRLSLFVADLGADQNFPHAYAIAYRANAAPTGQLELGFSVYTKSGGKGAPPATISARLIDLLPFFDASAYNNAFGTRGDFQFSDHYVGFDGRLRVRSLSSSLYWEVLLNDFDIRRLGSVFWEDAGHVFGIDLPPLSSSGRIRAILEYHHTGIRYYEHQQFTSGQTVHQTLTGDPLGPNAEGVYANVDWYATVQRRVGFAVALERRSNDQYVFLPEPRFGFSRISKSSREWTGRMLASWQLLPPRGQIGAQVQGGYERTRNFGFQSTNDISGFLGRVALQYQFQ